MLCCDLVCPFTCQLFRSSEFACFRPIKLRQAPAAGATKTANGTATNGSAQNGSHSLHDEHSVVLVLDYGSQYTQLICRRIREIGVFSMMFPGDADMVGGPAADTNAETAAAGQQQQQQ